MKKDTIIIEQNTLLPNKARKRFKKMGHPESGSNIISSLGLSEVMSRARLNTNLRDRLKSLLSKNTSDEEMYEPISMNELTFFLSLLKTRLTLDGISIYDAIDEMNKREKEFGGFNNLQQTCQDLELTVEEAGRIGWFPYYWRRNMTAEFRKKMKLGKTEAMKEAKRREKHGELTEEEKELREVAEYSTTPKYLKRR